MHVTESLCDSVDCIRYVGFDGSVRGEYLQNLVALQLVLFLRRFVSGTRVFGLQPTTVSLFL